jgi:hypothetical protein
MNRYLKLGVKRKVLNINYDYNDGDIATFSVDVTDDELDSYRPLFDAIKQNEGSFIPSSSEVYNPKRGDVSAEDIYTPIVGKELVDKFMNRFMYNYDYPPHTIDSIWVSEVSDIESIL